MLRWAVRLAVGTVLLTVMVGLIQSRTPVPAFVVSDAAAGVLADFGPDFTFGLATAPAHVEDRLDDSWLDFAKRGKVAAWSNHHQPERRVDFWTNPEAELDLAADAGVKVLRLGVDWGRIIPWKLTGRGGAILGRGVVGGAKPGYGWDGDALERYRQIILMAKERSMKVMLTLFHHSAPVWLNDPNSEYGDFGGWPSANATEYFVDFAEVVIDGLGAEVDYWTIFNEPHVYTILTHCAGVWPPGKEFSVLNALKCFSPFGDYARALSNMADAHKEVYASLHRQFPNAKVGVAHHVGYVTPRSVTDIPGALYNHFMSTFWFVDLIHTHCDFIGLNYYGQEFIDGDGVKIVPGEEYSDAGRGVYPDGLYRLLTAYHRRYPGQQFMLTENGVADDLDVIRGSYLIEHLLAIKAAMDQGVKVMGYVFWTISDNWEWADGYCPKFGLVAVDRANGLARTKRPSFDLFTAIATSGKVTAAQRDAAWAKVQQAAAEGVQRPFCRDLNAGGMTGAFGIDNPMPRAVVTKDWRYGFYETPLLADAVGGGMQAAWDRSWAHAQPYWQRVQHALKRYLAAHKAAAEL